MEIITIREHQYINVAKERDIANNTISFQDRDLLYNIEFKNQDNIKKYVFDIRRDKVKAKNFVGSIKLKNSLIIEILPKFFDSDLIDLSNKEKDIYIKNSREIFTKMLIYSDSITFLYLNDSTAINEIQSMPLIEVFIYLFAKKLLNELQEGLIFGYEKIEQNLNFIKGKFLAHKNLRDNLLNKSRFSIEFFEYSENNLLMKIFKSSIFTLLNRTNISYQTKSIFTEILFILNEIELIEFNLNLFDMIIFNRMNDRFEHLFFQLKSIMINLTPFTSNINPDDFWSILFDMDELFEKFISSLLKKSDINFMEQKSITVYFLKDFSKKAIARPDFIILDEKHNKIAILEAKWKILKNNKNLFGLDSSDFWQLSSYMNYTDESQIDGYFIIPKTTNLINSDIEFIASIEKHKSIKILTLDFSKDWNHLKNTFFEIKDKKLSLNEKIDMNIIQDNVISDNLNMIDITKQVLIESNNKPLSVEISEKEKSFYQENENLTLDKLNFNILLNKKIFEGFKYVNGYGYKHLLITIMNPKDDSISEKLELDKKYQTMTNLKINMKKNLYKNTVSEFLSNQIDILSDEVDNNKIDNTKESIQKNSKSLFDVNDEELTNLSHKNTPKEYKNTESKFISNQIENSFDKTDFDNKNSVELKDAIKYDLKLLFNLSFEELKKLSEDPAMLENLDFDTANYLINLEDETLKKEFKTSFSSMDCNLVDKRIVFSLSKDNDSDENGVLYILEELTYNKSFNVLDDRYFDLYFGEFLHKNKIRQLSSNIQDKKARIRLIEQLIDAINKMIDDIDENAQETTENIILGLAYIESNIFNDIKFAIKQKYTKNKTINYLLKKYCSDEKVKKNIKNTNFNSSIADKLVNLKKLGVDRDE